MKAIDISCVVHGWISCMAHTYWAGGVNYADVSVLFQSTSICVHVMNTTHQSIDTYNYVLINYKIIYISYIQSCFHMSIFI